MSRPTRRSARDRPRRAPPPVVAAPAPPGRHPPPPTPAASPGPLPSPRSPRPAHASRARTRRNPSTTGIGAAVPVPAGWQTASGSMPFGTTSIRAAAPLAAIIVLQHAGHCQTRDPPTARRSAPADVPVAAVPTRHAGCVRLPAAHSPPGTAGRRCGAPPACRPGNRGCTLVDQIWLESPARHAQPPIGRHVVG